MTIKSVRTLFIVACISAFLLTGCSVYRPELHQGQTLKQEDIDQISEGMSALEVRDILGTPLITDVFNNQRWDYVYNAYDRDRNLTDLARVTIIFADGVVESVVSDSEMPAQMEHLDATPERSKKGWFSSLKQKFSNFRKKNKSENEDSESSE